jgi:hypothetical protein
MSSKPFKLVCSDGVADVLSECEHMINEARNWSSAGQWAKDTGVSVEDVDAWRQKYTEMQAKVNEMDRSFHRCLFQLIQLASSMGEVQLSWDSKCSLFFHEPATGYHGGMIYHPNYHDGKTILPVGTWSLHT